MAAVGGQAVAEPGLSPEQATALGAGGLAAGYGAVRLLIDLAKWRAERRKLLNESETAHLLGEKAVAEARNAGVLELANILAALRLQQSEDRALLRDLREDLDHERERSRRFRGAVLRFIGSITQLLPDMPIDVRSRVQAALDTLRQSDG